MSPLMDSYAIADGVSFWRSPACPPVPGEPSVVNIALATIGFIVATLVSRPLSSMLSRTYSKLSDAERYDWDSRVISTFHAAIAFPMAFHSAMYSPEFSSLSRAMEFPPHTFSIFHFVLGYMYCDTLFLVLNRHLYPEWKVYVFHHFVVISYVTSCLAYGCGMYFAILSLIFEATNPFVNLHFFLEKRGKGGTLFALLNDAIVFLLFFVFRILNQIWLGYEIFVGTMLEGAGRNAGSFPLVHTGLVLFCYSMIVFLNTKWFGVLCGMVVKVVFGASDVSDTKKTK